MNHPNLKENFQCYHEKLLLSKTVQLVMFIVFRVVTRHYVSCTKNKYVKANRIHICPEHFTDNIEAY